MSHWGRIKLTHSKILIKKKEPLAIDDIFTSYSYWLFYSKRPAMGCMHTIQAHLLVARTWSTKCVIFAY